MGGSKMIRIDTVDQAQSMNPEGEKKAHSVSLSNVMPVKCAD